MDATARQHIDNLQNTNADDRYASFQYLIETTNKPVKWAHEVWDYLLQLMVTGDNHQRTMAAQLLSNLAKSDKSARIPKDFNKLIQATKDERFVTARHSLQSLWKVGVVNKDYQHLVINALSDRFAACTTEKNCTLIRYDILEVFRKIYDRMKDEAIVNLALDLIDTEADAQYRKKYASLWKVKK